jgi:hypothetical protein
MVGQQATRSSSCQLPLLIAFCQLSHPLRCRTAPEKQPCQLKVLAEFLIQSLVAKIGRSTTKIASRCSNRSRSGGKLGLQQGSCSGAVRHLKGWAALPTSISSRPISCLLCQHSLEVLVLWYSGHCASSCLTWQSPVRGRRLFVLPSKRWHLVRLHGKQLDCAASWWRSWASFQYARLRLPPATEVQRGLGRPQRGSTGTAAQ